MSHITGKNVGLPKDDNISSWSKLDVQIKEKSDKLGENMSKPINTSIIVIIFIIFVIGGLLSMVIIFSLQSKIEDNSIELFSLSYTPSNCHISSSCEHLMCYGAQNFSFYKLNGQSRNYTVLRRSDVIFSETEEIVGGDIGNGIAVLIIRSISPETLTSETLSSSRLIVYDLKPDIATQINVPLNLSDGSLLAKGVTINNENNRLLIGVLSSFNNRLSYKILSYTFNGEVYENQEILVNRTGVSPLTGGELSSNILNFTVFTPEEDSQGVCRIYEFLSSESEESLLIGVLYGKQRDQTNEEYGLSSNDNQFNLTSCQIDVTGRILFCVVQDRTNTLSQSVIMFSRLDYQSKFWSVKKGVFAKRNLLPEDIATNIKVSLKGSYFTVSFPTSADIPVFNLYRIDPDDGHGTSNNLPITIKGFGQRFNSNSLLGLDFGCSLKNRNTARIMSISPIDSSFIYFDVNI
jgi:hypothetical protein